MNEPKQSVEELEGHLRSARTRFHKSQEAIEQVHGDDVKREFKAAWSGLLTAERGLAKAKGEQYAETIDFPYQWDLGAPYPHLLQSDDRAFLAYLMPEDVPDWQWTYLTVVVEFVPCLAAKLGSPNDEVFEGHPLHGRGLEGYRAQEVHNSEWLEEIKRINSVHSQYSPTTYSDVRHFAFWFHGSSVECLAKSYTVEVYREEFVEVLKRLCDKFVEG